MIPTPFEYHRPTSLEEALAVLGSVPDAKVLSGGHSLLPAMKLRLAQPPAVIDISRLAGLNHIRLDGGRISIGALTTHREIEDSPLLKEKCPLMPEVAARIGDGQVRNRGTLAGSLAHADPAADWPAAILALDAELVVAGAAGLRSVSAREFFVAMMQTAVQANEILTEIRIPATGESVAYVKTAQQASGFAIAGVAVVLDGPTRAARVGVTGVSAVPYRALLVENALAGKALDREAHAAAAEMAAQGQEALGDIHASAEFRAHLARVNTRRALDLAASRS